MIHGIGTDIVDLARINKLYQRYGELFIKRLLNQTEQQQLSGCLDIARLLAKRFAAKEAFAKAIGTGLRAPVSLRNISITHDHLGKPIFEYHEVLKQYLTQKNIAQVHLSLSDEQQFIIAFAIAESFDKSQGKQNSVFKS